MKMAVGSVLSGTGAIGTDVVVTGLDFQPRVVFCQSGQASTDADALQTSAWWSYGFHANGKNRCIAINQQDNAADDQRHSLRNDRIVESLDNNGTVVGALAVQSLDGDGFTLDTVVQYTGARVIMYVALGGDDIEEADIQDVTLPGVTGNNDQQPFAFDPNFLMLIGNIRTTEGLGANIKASIGMTNGDAQYVMSVHSDDGAGNISLCGAYIYDGEMFASAGRPTAVTARAAFVEWLTGGWRWNVLATGVAQKIYVLGMKCTVKPFLGDLLSQTDTTTQIVESGFAFQPAGAMLFSDCFAKSPQGASDNTHARLSVGAWTSSANRRAFAFGADDNNDPPRAESIYETDELYANITFFIIQGLMDSVSLDEDGFTNIMDDADPSQAFCFYVAFNSTEPDTRDRLLRYHENAYLSRLRDPLRGLPVILDTQGRQIAAHQLMVNELIRSDGPYLPSTEKHDNLLEDQAVGFIESKRSDDSGKLTLRSAKESLLEGVLRRLSRSG